MLRLPAVAGRFYPSNPKELTALVREYSRPDPQHPPVEVKACLVPHAGYMYSGHVAGAVLARIALPKKMIVLGVRHYPRGEPVAILSSGAWRTPLGDAPIDEAMAADLRGICPLLREDSVAHSGEHSLEVQIPFLQVLAPDFSFVPVALGTVQFESLVSVGKAVAQVLGGAKENVLLLTSSDLNHYQDEKTTRVKDQKAIDRLLAFDPRGLYDTCRNEDISMCGLGPAVAMLTALNILGAKKSELVKHATSGEISGDYDQVVGYAGMIFF
ncbi:MAG TPA: AmmeMemoRadiSam system protein B [Candidatus Acidoferrum sp.]|nr:AmmeMemoRadiSam system protein B [Candidatus Acidoferrum sp.]